MSALFLLCFYFVSTLCVYFASACFLPFFLSFPRLIGDLQLRFLATHTVKFEELPCGAAVCTVPIYGVYAAGAVERLCQLLARI